MGDRILDELRQLADHRTGYAGCDIIKRILEEIGDAYRGRSIIISPAASPDIVQMFRDSGMKVSFRQIVDTRSELEEWESMINIITNLKGRLTISNDIHYCLMDYCLLGKIPFRLKHFDAPGRILLPEEIELLSDENKQFFYNTDSRYYLKCLKECGFREDIEIMADNFPTRSFMEKLSAITSMLFSDDDHYSSRVYRQNIDNEDLYTNPWLNRFWRRLTPQQIFGFHFNPEHLISIGIKVPRPNLLSCHPRDITNLKRVLPYHDIPHLDIEELIEKSDRVDLINNKYRLYHIIIILVRYKRELMKEFQDHPFVNHLLQISSTKMKSSTTK